jgi:CO/xanthine dehydrogenase Mo-binding subunit
MSKAGGQSLRRVDALEKVTGRARYTADMRLPGMLYARVLRCPHPAARITSFDDSKARGLSGVHAVLSAANTPRIPWYKDSFVFDTTLRFAGDEVAAVAAESEDLAEDALRRISVDWEPLEFETALKVPHPDSARVPDEPTVTSRGDIAAGFDMADVKIDETYTTPRAVHNSLEAHGTTAAWEAGTLTLWDSTQAVFEVRRGIAEALDLPLNAVRVVKQYMGGGFGSKQIAWKNAVLAALLSKRTGRPVQLMLDRQAENTAVGHRNATRQRVRMGATRAGKLTAIDAQIIQGVGAYMTGGEASDTEAPYLLLYRCENVRTEKIPVYTNSGPAVAFRAPGYAEAAFALESAMDELAHALGMDPIELRQKNYATTDQQKKMPYSTPDGLTLCFERGSAEFGWRTANRSAEAGSKRRGVGAAAHLWGGGGFSPAHAWLRWNPDTSIDVVTGTQDIGTGTRTSLTQIVAAELQVDPSIITVHLGDTANGPYAPTSAGSATLASVGPAVREAAIRARETLLEHASEEMGIPVDQLCLDGDAVVATATSDTRLPVSDLLKALSPDMILAEGSRGPNASDVSVKSFGVQFAEVEVDTLTGEVDVTRVVAVHECGRVVNHDLLNSQIVGGVIQGVGFALYEQQIFDDKLGLPLNANLEEYLVPTVADIPHVEAFAIDVPDMHANELGVKGIGEPPIIPTAPAIANAVYDAVGIRIRDLPLSRERVLEEIGKQQN